ncbi:metallo-beta-lactamase superfamily protein [Aspergillus steynii IBT 23096]|uniref:Metallo-beta-lactamase superfamily protein n=1 Tax=Aspergillus steynii IBT 23096 TaxID=1392250 RepID=A0A2I2GLV3_9EURO|nr:metallo-beta-lactamase superfamily protein [Aspergillus steynii IBT 23096]PLB53854.1 metallo-beta-lactamase superfamily protein [Aspergillus steynii IBT 23096]
MAHHTESDPDNNRRIKVTFLSTGTVKIRPSMRSQPANSHMLLRRLRSLTDWGWTDALPVGVFLVQHPQGPILFDTGQSPLCNEPGYFPWWNMAGNSLAKFSVPPEEGLLAQLRAQGVDPVQLQAIVLSHLHNDHTGGLKEVHEAAPNVPIYVSEQQWRVFGEHPFHAAVEGCVPSQWPENFNPKLLEEKDIPVGPWATSYPVTADGKVIAVDTAGHVPGHVSLVVYGENDDGAKVTYFLTGDAVYGLDLLDIEQPDGINSDPQRALKSLKLIKQFAAENEVVVLPSHDVNTAQILVNSTVYKPK